MSEIKKNKKSVEELLDGKLFRKYVPLITRAYRSKLSEGTLTGLDKRDIESIERFLRRNKAKIDEVREIDEVIVSEIAVAENYNELYKACRNFLIVLKALEQSAENQRIQQEEAQRLFEKECIIQYEEACYRHTRMGFVIEEEEDDEEEYVSNCTKVLNTVLGREEQEAE